jgi:phage terminase large subunit-like protein
MTSTRSRRAADLSPEIQWYLEARGHETPTCTPLIRTPEPRNVKGAQFDPARVDRVIEALGALRHTKGKWAGRPIVPTATQVAYIIAPVFGWTAPNSEGERHRIIRDAYVEMPRKGAKTTLVSGLATVLAFADDEMGAEVLMGAASRDQAGQAFKPIAALAKNSKTLLDAGIKPTKVDIVQESTGSFIKAVSSRGDLAHGANVHGGLVDELHVHKNPDLLEAIESGTGARTQPLVFIITTADDGQTTSVYAQRRDLIEKLGSRTLKAPAMYGVVFAAEEDDDPFDPATWARANPLYPVTPSPEFMKAASEKAQSSPAQLASFLRLHLGIRAKQDKRFFDLPRWDRNASTVDLTKLEAARAFGGLDLGSVSDLTALVWLFPDSPGYDVLCRFWMPEEALDALDAKTARTASGWVKDGHITLTPGDVTDYDYIKAQVQRDLDEFDVQGIGFDRWNSSQLVIDLEAEGAPMVKVGQGVQSMSAPLKELERLVKAGTAPKPLLRHGGNPVLRWMADNLRIYSDASGNIKPDKARSMDKIDGISALTTGMALAMPAEQAATKSVYESRGLVSL